MTHSHRNNPHHSLRLLTAILSYLPGLVTIPDKIVRLFMTTLLVVFVQVEFTAYGLKLRLVFARAVCWPQIHLPQALIGCWIGLLNLARLVWRLARAPN